MKRTILISIFLISSLIGQEKEKASTYFVFEPTLLNINVGADAKLNIKLIDKDGSLVKVPFTIYSANDPGIGPTPTWPGTSINIVPRVSDDSGEANVIVQPIATAVVLEPSYIVIA